MLCAHIHTQGGKWGTPLNAVKCNLTELTTKSSCVPSRVCGFVMHTHQCIHLRQRSFMSNASACSRGLHSLSLCVACSCTCASACMEPALVSLCSQRSSVVHMCVAPHVCCSAILPWSIDSGLFLPLPFPFFHCICYISVKSVLLPFCMGAHSWVARICQSWEQVVANSGSYWMTGALNLHLAMLLLTTWHPSQFLLMSRKHNN